MWRRRLGIGIHTRQLHQPQVVRNVAFMGAAFHSTREAPSGIRHHDHNKHALFRRLLHVLEGAPLRDVSSSGSRSVYVEAAIPLDEPLAANVALMEQLGVLDLVGRRSLQEFAAPSNALDSGDRLAALPPVATRTMTEACKAGVACHLPPTVVLQKVVTATKQMCSGNDLCLPPVAASVLLRCAADRIVTKAAMLQRCIDGREAPPLRKDRTAWPRSDQGEPARLRWALGEERRRGYELLVQIPQRPQAAKLLLQQQKEEEEELVLVMDELRARLELALALQDGELATAAAEELLTLCAQQTTSPSCNAGVDATGGFSLSDVAHAVGMAISAFRFSRDFAAGWSLFEKFNALVSRSCLFASGGRNNNDSTGNETTSGGAGNAAALTTTMVATNKLWLLTAVAECIDTDAAHFTCVRDAVVQLFATTDVGYFSSNIPASRNAMCAVLDALSRVSLEPRAKMDAAQAFFSALQQTSHADVCDSVSITEALLQVASAARDGNVALLLYNRLADPSVRRAEVSANIAAVLLAERDAMRDVARFFSFLRLGRRVISSTAVHLLVAKLLLQRQPGQEQKNHGHHQNFSEVLYTLLDLIDARREVEPQRSFFLRLLVLYRDLVAEQQRQQQQQQDLGSGVPDLAVVPHAQRILTSWADEFRAAGVTTLSYTTLAMLQCLHRLLALSPLLSCIDTMLSEFSVGWLRHRAAASRTPAFHLPASRLRQLVDDIGTTGIIVKAVCNAAVRAPESLPFPPTHKIAASAPKPEECCAAVKKTFDALCLAADEGGVVVLGFSDYVRLCALEDAGQNLGGAHCVTSSSPSRGKFCFSLDSLSIREPPVYVTDALGEMVLREGMERGNDASAIRCILPVDEMPRESSPCLGGNDTLEKKWLLRWLEESLASSHRVCGVFERQLDHLLRATPLPVEAACAYGQPTAFSCFVSVG